MDKKKTLNISKLSPPPISVLMSVYNGSEWLGHSIESIQNQNFGDFEFIIVNDGSLDDSLEIISEYARTDARLKVLDKTNTGLTKSLNYGAGIARGDWIARIDADDLAHKNRLKRQYSHVISNPDIKLLGSTHQLIDEHGKPGALYSLPSKHKYLKKRLLKKQSFFSHSSAFFSRELFNEISGYRNVFKRAQDYDLWLRFSEKTKIGCLSEPLVYIRKHDSQISHTAGGKLQLIDSRIALYSYFHRFRGEIDPLDLLNTDEQFDKLRGFINKELELRRFFDVIDFKESLKEKRRSNSLSDILILFYNSLISDRKLLSIFVKHIIIGENIVSEIYHDRANLNLEDFNI